MNKHWFKNYVTGMEIKYRGAFYPHSIEVKVQRRICVRQRLQLTTDNTETISYHPYLRTREYDYVTPRSARRVLRALSQMVNQQEAERE